jgi:hypothetical protein
MDNYRQDSAYTGISRPIPATYQTLSPEDKAIFRNWRRAVLAFYAAVLLMNGLVLMASIPASHTEVAQVMPAVNVP